jgi:hypothetical protein
MIKNVRMKEPPYPPKRGDWGEFFFHGETNSFSRGIEITAGRRDYSRSRQDASK